MAARAPLKLLAVLLQIDAAAILRLVAAMALGSGAVAAGAAAVATGWTAPPLLLAGGRALRLAQLRRALRGDDHGL